MASRPKLTITPASGDIPETVEDQWESAAQVRPRKLGWLWPRKIAEGVLTILEGEKGTGKSTLAGALAAAVTAGAKLPGRRKQPAGDVLWLAGEESVEVSVQPRLKLLGADLDRVHFPAVDARGQRRRLVLPCHTGQLESAIHKWCCRLLVIDPVSSFVGSDVDLRVDQSIHQTLDPLADLAAASNCSCLLTRNLTKDRGASRLDRGLGGAGLAGVARTVLVIDWPDRRTKRRVLRTVVTNLTDPAPALEYYFGAGEGDKLLGGWKEIQAADDDPDGDLSDLGERDQRGDARVLLRRLIGDQWISAKAVIAESDGAGISPRTLRTAKAELGVRSVRRGSSTPAYWEWGPPVKGWD